MGDIAFPVSKAKVGYYWSLPAASDAIALVPLSSVEADATLANHTTLSDLLSGSTEQTVVGRKTLTGVITTNGSGHTVELSADDVVWSSTSGPDFVAVVICYVPNTSTSTDADLIPLSKQDYAQSTGGSRTIELTPAIRVS
jgi:hypothetical protein